MSLSPHHTAGVCLSMVTLLLHLLSGSGSGFPSEEEDEPWVFRKEKLTFQMTAQLTTSL